MSKIDNGFIKQPEYNYDLCPFSISLSSLPVIGTLVDTLTLTKQKYSGLK